MISEIHYFNTIESRPCKMSFLFKFTDPSTKHFWQRQLCVHTSILRCPTTSCSAFSWQKILLVIMWFRSINPKNSIMSIEEMDHFKSLKGTCQVITAIFVCLFMSKHSLLSLSGFVVSYKINSNCVILRKSATAALDTEKRLAVVGSCDDLLPACFNHALASISGVCIFKNNSCQSKDIMLNSLLFTT